MQLSSTSRIGGKGDQQPSGRADSVHVSSYLRQRRLPAGARAYAFMRLQRLAWEITRSCRQICYLWTWDNDWWMFVLGNQNNLLAQNNFARKRARMQNTE
ncbi:hypothetical protein PVAP13_1KG450005, partial [Panicum virgatum]